MTTINIVIDKDKIQTELFKKLEAEIATPGFESWVKPMKVISVDEKELVMSTNSNLSRGWVCKNCIGHIKKFAQEITGKNLNVKIEVEQDKPTKPSRSRRPKKEETPAPINKSTSLTEDNIDSLKSLSNNLNLKYTFKTFVVGENSKFCHAAAYSVAKAPAKTHNPLFIYGGVGLGKTHLMQAIGHYILSNHPGLQLKYVSAETFTNDLITSLRTDKMPAFRAKYRKMDVLLIDDIQFIEGKETTQEEVFHTFNTLHQAGKQIILTSDRHPENIPTLTDRLRSRFEWGLLADIQPPDLETRIAILKNKVERDEVNISDEILEIIATAFQGNVRKLEGALNRVIAYMSINEQPLTVESVRKILNFSGRTKNLNLDKIIEVTAQYFALEPSEIKGPARAKEISHARQVAIYLVRELTNSSFPSIGIGFGGRKHSSILYAYERMREELQTNRALSETINEISGMISSQ